MRMRTRIEGWRRAGARVVGAVRAAGGLRRRVAGLGVVLAGLVLGLGLAAGCRSKPEPAPRTAPQAPSGGGSVSSVPSHAWQREAERWLGAPYQRGGGTKAGVDCSGFVQQVYLKVARVSLPRITRDQFRIGYQVGRSELRPGDLVFFDTLGRGVSHVGLMVGGDRFAHASTSKGVTYSRLSETYWNRQFLGARRLPRRGRRGRRRVGSLVETPSGKSFDTPEKLPADCGTGLTVTRL